MLMMAVDVIGEARYLFVTYHEPVLQLLLAAALGGLIGLEREASGKPAGFRTNLLICVGAALLTQISYEIAADAAAGGGPRGDPGRIPGQIVSGIGFLGAGTILHARGSVTGLTTAATLWVVAALGIAVGAGSYVLAIVGTTLVLLALMILGRFEDHLIPRRSNDRVIRVILEPNVELLAGLEALIMSAGLLVAGFDVEREQDALVASFQARGSPREMNEAVRELLVSEGVTKVMLM
jgi:putative Mg2+ transporter-C (MgtC) family protein